MELRVLGPLEVVRNHTVVDIGTPRQRALLAVLAVERDRMVPADRLVDLLWGGEPPDRAMATIQTYISNLRRALEPDRPPRAPAEVLVTQPPGYRLRLAAEQVDAHRFERLVLDARRLLDADPQAASDRLEEGLTLWRGPAYAEVATELFAVGEVARLDELRLSALEDRADACLRMGRHEEASSMLERFVRDEPLRERGRMLLALAQYRAGRQVEALRTLEEGRRRLRDELGLDPGPELRRLEQRILDHDPGLASEGTMRITASAAPTPAAPAAVPAPAGEPALAPSPELPRPAATPFVGASTLAADDGEVPDLLVGRDAELARLRAAVARTRAGRGGLMLLEGEAGIGKTALAEQLIEDVRAVGGIGCIARCLEGDATPPFWPVVQILRQVLAALPEQSVEALRPRLAGLADLLPEMTDERAGAPSDPELARLRLFDSIAAILRDYLEGRPDIICVVVDDLHLADSSTLGLLRAITPEMPNHRNLFVATIRTGQAHPATFTSTIDGLIRLPAVERLTIGPLSKADTAELVRRESGLGPDVGAVVHARSDGNPFLTLELARLLRAEGGSDPLAASQAVPVEILDVVKRRLARLPAEAQRVLQLAAVAGVVFDVDIVEQVGGFSGDSALDHLELAMVNGLVLDEDPNRWRFAHALIADAVRSMVPAPRRARWSAQIAAVLERKHGTNPDRWASIAHLYLEAVDVGERDPALRWTIQAADHAIRSAAFEQAAHMLRRALRCARTIEDADERLHVEAAVLHRLAYCVADDDGYDTPDGNEFLRVADEVVRRRLTGPRVVAVLAQAAIDRCERGELAQADVLIDRLDELAVDDPDATLQYLRHDARGVALWLRGRLAESVAAFDEADRVAAEHPDPDWAWRALVPRVRVPVLRSLVRALQGDLDGSQHDLDTAVAMEAQPSMFSVGYVRLFALLRALQLGELPEIERYAALGAEDGHGFERIRHPSLLVQAIESWPAAMKGDEAAREAMERSILAAEASGLGATVTILRARLAEALLAAGLAAEAGRVLEAASVHVARGERFWEPELHRVGALVAAALGDAEGAEQSRTRARAVAEELGAGLLLARL